MKEKKKMEWDKGKINSKPSILSVILFLKLHAMYGCFYVICTFISPDIFVVYIIYVYVIIYIKYNEYREGMLLKETAALPEDLGSTPNTYMVA